MLAPSETTARIRGSAAAAVSASSPPIDSPTAPMRLRSTSGIRSRNDTAAATSRFPYQPQSIAGPPLSPCPRASSESTPYPCRARATRWSNTLVRVDPEPWSRTTAAPFRDGTYPIVRPEGHVPESDPGVRRRPVGEDGVRRVRHVHGQREGGDHVV